MQGMVMADLALLRVLQLASPSMPVGAFSYSQALELVVEQGIVRDRASAMTWLRDQLTLNLARNDAPLFCRLFDAAQSNDASALRRWNSYWLATRESAELRAETLNMGAALRRILPDAGYASDAMFVSLGVMPEISYAAVFAYASVRAGIQQREALLAYLWVWLEGQVLAAMKLIPLGQSAGQAMLNELIPAIEVAAAAASGISDDELTNFAPGFAVASAQHETQYSRLFRS